LKKHFGSETMRKLMLALGAMSLAVPAAVVLPAATAQAKAVDYKASSQDRRYKNKRNAKYREWRGRDGRTYCRKPDGTTGLLVGAVGGALLGRTVDTRGDRTAGTVLGGVGGALLGREIDRSGSKCR
jgi:uncharacterized protein YcfJ